MRTRDLALLDLEPRQGISRRKEEDIRAQGQKWLRAKTRRDKTLVERATGNSRFSIQIEADFFKRFSDCGSTIRLILRVAATARKGDVGTPSVRRPRSPPDEQEMGYKSAKILLLRD